jgi:hypothetical protein
VRRTSVDKSDHDFGRLAEIATRDVREIHRDLKWMAVPARTAAIASDGDGDPGGRCPADVHDRQHEHADWARPVVTTGAADTETRAAGLICPRPSFSSDVRSARYFSLNSAQMVEPSAVSMVTL